MNVIIPMSGQGTRFRNAGYNELKPLIKIHGKTIIEHIIEKFQGEIDFYFICDEEHLSTTKLKSVLSHAKPEGKIIPIKRHKFGPVHAVMQAIEYIKDEEPYIVNYCDFNWDWDYNNFKQKIQDSQVDGSIICYKGFHPHLLGPNFYASVKTDKNAFVEEIKEKHSYTQDKMDSWQSSGTYYFKKGKYIKQYFQELMESHESINNEYYVSMVYNFLKKDNLKISVYEIPYFCQWGTPEDFEEYAFYADYFINDKNSQQKKSFIQNLQVLIPMAGEGSRFAKEGYTVSKPLIPVSNLPMIFQAVNSLPQGDKYFFVGRKEHVIDFSIDILLKKTYPVKEFLVVDKTTEGQACTCLLAKEYIDKDKPLLIGACDNGIVMNHSLFKNMVDQGTDVIPFAFNNYHNANRYPEMYGWVETDDRGFTKNISVKKKISDNVKEDFGIVGAFYFRKAEFFFQAADAMLYNNDRINNEFYVDTCINYSIKLGHTVKPFLIDKYICWGTPNDLRVYEYWEKYFSLKNYKV